MTTGKTIALMRQIFVGKVMSLLFNMLSRLVITFLPRSKHLLISWLQSPTGVILEPPKIESLTIVTISPSCITYSRKEYEKEYMYMYHFALEQKLTQHCKSTILQLKKKKKSGPRRSFWTSREAIMAGDKSGRSRGKGKVKRDLTQDLWAIWTHEQITVLTFLRSVLK